MKRHRIFTSKRMGLVILVSLILTSCLSLAEDITPPPDVTLVQIQAETSPTLQPTGDAPSSPESEGENEAVSGLVSVIVVDQTDGLLFEEDPEIILEGYDQFEPAFEASLPVPVDGLVEFSDIPFPEGRVYFASIPYGGAVYRSQIVMVEGDTAGLELQVEIYKTTTDQSGLVIDRLHVLMDFNQPGLVDIVEIFIISNFGDATIVPASAGEISVEFPLPSGAMGIGFEDGALGQRYLKTDQGFGDTVSIPPGSGIYPVSVYYSLPYENDKFDFVQRLNYPVGAVVVMLPAGEIILQGIGLEDHGVQSIPSGEVQVFSASSIEADETLEFSVSGKLAVEVPATENPAVPAPLPDGAKLSDVIVYGAGALGVILVIGGVLLMIRRRQQDDPLREEDILGESADDIMDSIIALDDLYANGDINEKDYQEKRKELKEKLKSISEV
jgi:hypothetical protein